MSIKEGTTPVPFCFLAEKWGLSYNYALKSMKNSEIDKFLEKFLIEDLFAEIYSILANPIIPTEKKLTILGEKYRPRLDYIKADILIKTYERKTNGKKKKRF